MPIWSIQSIYSYCSIMGMYIMDMCNLITAWMGNQKILYFIFAIVFTSIEILQFVSDQFHMYFM